MNANDPRECGWMGCHHPRCERFCDGVPLDEWREWRVGVDLEAGGGAA